VLKAALEPEPSAMVEADHFAGSLQFPPAMDVQVPSAAKAYAESTSANAIVRARVLDAERLTITAA
jgi:hypothetical protein